MKHKGGKLYGQHPYTFHLEMAVDELKAHVLTLPTLKYYDHDIIVCATWLHDVIEDTGTTAAELGELFVPQVVELVQVVTDGPGRNRKEKKAGVYAAIRGTGPASLAVKMGDRLANAKACGLGKDESPMLQMYRKEQPLFEEEMDRPFATLINFPTFIPAFQQVRRYLGMDLLRLA